MKITFKDKILLCFGEAREGRLCNSSPGKPYPTCELTILPTFPSFTLFNLAFSQGFPLLPRYTPI